MKKIVIISILFFVLAINSYSQYDCKVLVDNLKGQYNGDCKRGLANGEGSAKGIDTYIGKFKKGLPNGFGVYTYENGSNFIGNFSKGLKDGYGLHNIITEAGDLVQDYGLWMADSLIVPNDSKALFKVNLSKGIKIVDPKITRGVSTKNQVWINFQVDGVLDNSVTMGNAEISDGKKIDTRERSLNTLVAFDEIKEFPVTIKLKYQIRKTDQPFMVDCQTEIILFTPGLWEININH